MAIASDMVEAVAGLFLVFLENGYPPPHFTGWHDSEAQSELLKEMAEQIKSDPDFLRSSLYQRKDVWDFLGVDLGDIEL